MNHEFSGQIFEKLYSCPSLMNHEFSGQIFEKFYSSPSLMNHEFSWQIFETFYSCPSLKNHEFSRQILEKSPNIKLNKNPSRWSRVVSCGRTNGRTDEQTDRHDEANSRFSQFCLRVSKKKKRLLSIWLSFNNVLQALPTESRYAVYLFRPLNQ